MSGSVCDVCGGKAAGVGSSSITAGSFAYCPECIRVGAEPYDIIVGLFVGSGVEEEGLEGLLDKCIDGVREMVDVSLERAGKSREQLVEDVKRADKELQHLIMEEDFEEYRDIELEQELDERF